MADTLQSLLKQTGAQLYRQPGQEYVVAGTTQKQQQPDSYRLYLPGSAGQPSVIYTLDPNLLSQFGVQPGALPDVTTLSKQLGLTTPNGDFYGIAGGQNFNDIGGVQNVLSSYAQNAATKNTQQNQIQQSNVNLGSNAYQGQNSPQQTQPLPTTPQPAQPVQAPQPVQPTVAFPTVSLQPGATGMEVKKLQDYLVSQGLMTPEQVATGPGIYGPQTTAAVLELQKKLGIDYSSGPGYFGPKTLAALQATPTTQPTQTTPGVTAPIGSADRTNQLLQVASQQTGIPAQTFTNQPNQTQPIVPLDNQGNVIQGATPNQPIQTSPANVPTSNPADIAQATAPAVPPQQSPSDFIATYTQALKDLGIPSIKEQFDKVTKEYNDLQNELNDKIADINDNPWLTEGIRVAQINKLKERYQGKFEILTNQQQIYDNLYQEGIAQAKFLTTGQIDQQQNAFDNAIKAAQAEAALNKTDQPATTSDITEYKFAQEQGYAGSFTDYLKEQANLKNVAVKTSSVSSGGSSSSGGGSTSTTFDRIVSGAGSIADLTPSEKTKVQDQLYSQGYYEANPPKWFIDQVQNQLQQSVTSDKLKELWDAYRNPIINPTSSTNRAL